MKKKERINTGRSNKPQVKDPSKLMAEPQPGANQANIRNSQVESSSSWGELLQNYKISQTHVPWAANQRETPEFRTSYNIKRQERAYDPVLCKFRDPSMEQTFKHLEHGHKSQARANGVSHAAERNQSFNIINNMLSKANRHALRKSTDSFTRTKPKVPDSRTPFNILSNKDYPEGSAQHTSMKDTANMKAWINSQGSITHPEKLVHHAPGTQEHDFNIVSNKYMTNHDDKERMDNDAAKALAASKYWQTHNYDAIAGKFCDPQKENQFQTFSKTMSNQTAGVPAAARQPISYQQSEGAAYDILSNTVFKDAGKRADAVIAIQVRFLCDGLTQIWVH
jgi:hypothetical protein